MRMTMLVLGACAGLCAGAAEIVVGAGETHVVSNASSLVQSDAVRLADRAVLEKRGLGELTLQMGAFTEPKDVAVNAREGTVKVASSEPLVSAYAQPTEVMNKAVFWLESETSLVMKEGSETEVCEWRDVRETGDGTAANPFVYPRAVTNFLASRVYPVKASYLSKPALYFGGYGSGVWMNWVKPNGTQATVGNLRNVFLVHGAASGWGYTLGQRMGQSPYFQLSGNYIWIYHNFENAPMHASRTYLDGKEIDPFSTQYANGRRHVVEVECLGTSQSAQCFYNDRDMQVRGLDGTNTYNAAGEKLNPITGSTAQTGGGNRVGGEYIYEMILFTNQLTVAERMAVSDWLNQKWQGITPPASAPAVTVTLASNAVLSVEASAASVTLQGDGILRKTGAEHMAFRSSYAPRQLGTRVAVEAGTLALGYALPFVCAGGDTVTSELRYWGPEYAPPVAGGDATRLVKNGSGPLALDAIPAGVRKIQVNGGSLTLGDPVKTDHPLSPVLPAVEADPAATSTTFGFEEFVAKNAQYQNIADGGTTYGWHAIVPGLLDGKTQDSQVFLYNTAKGSRTSWGLPETAPEGTCVLTIKNNASAWTTVEIPSDGEYVLSFWAAPRTATYMGQHLDVMLGPDADHLTALGTFLTSSSAWTKFTFFPRYLTAGTYQLWFKNQIKNDDRCTLFDAIALTRVQDRDGSYAIPNGDFETHDVTFENTFTLANTNRVPGFTVKQAESIGSATAGSENLPNANAYTTFSVYNTDSWLHFNLPWNRPESRTQFMMTGNDSQLSTTFRPPAGTWRFAADFALWQLTANVSQIYDIRAQVTIGDESVDLGTVTNGVHALVQHAWPNAFTVDGETDVTLTLTGAVHEKCSCGHGILDNLVLLAAHAGGASLLKDGGFESGGWSFEITPKPVNSGGSQKISGSDYFAYGSTNSMYALHYGTEHFQGANCLKLVNDDAVYQSVTFPTGGLYRFSANLETRAEPGCNMSWGLNPVAFYLARGGVTNWLGCTDTVATTNFNEYAFVVRVPPEGGTYDVGFRGRTVSGATWETKQDKTTLVDGAQLYRIETERAIDIPETLELELAAGTQLTLDFDGTNEIARLVLNGVSRAGVISLAECPQLLGTLSGRGALYIRPKGTVFLIR